MFISVCEFEGKELCNEVEGGYLKGQYLSFTKAICFQCTFPILVFSSSVLAVFGTLTVCMKNIQLLLLCSSV